MNEPTYAVRTDAFVKPHRKLLSEAQELELFRLWRETDDKVYWEKIVISYTPLIRKLCKDLAGYGMDPEELISEGLLGLTEAAGRFEPERGLRFSTYAKCCIRGVMYAYITRNYFPVNPCTRSSSKKLFFSMRRFIMTEFHKSGHFAMTPEIITKLAEENEVSEKEIVAMNAMFRRPTESLDEPIGREGGETVTKGDFYPSPTETPDQLYETSAMDDFRKTMIEEAMARVLTTREKDIFVSQLLQEKDDASTLEDLGERFNISKERVRQIRNTAMDKMSRELKRRTSRAELFV